MTQVVTKVCFKLVLEMLQLHWFTVFEDQGKKAVKGITGAHASGFCEALTPFIIIFQEAACEACSMERRMEDIVESAQVTP